MAILILVEISSVLGIFPSFFRPIFKSNSDWSEKQDASPIASAAKFCAASGFEAHVRELALLRL
jgi:hypothetical protein